MPPQIPRIVHQIWWQGADQVPENRRAAQRTWQRELCAPGTGWLYLLWSEPEIDQLFETSGGPEILRRYRGLTDMIQKVDYAKLLILWVYGGCYADMDALCIPENMDAVITEAEPQLVMCEMKLSALSKTATRALGHGKALRPLINNAFVGAVPEHPLLTKLLLTLENSPRKKFEQRAIWVYRTCGPLAINRVLNDDRQLLPGCRKGIKWRRMITRIDGAEHEIKLYKPSAFEMAETKVRRLDPARSFGSHHAGMDWMNPGLLKDTAQFLLKRRLAQVILWVAVAVVAARAFVQLARKYELLDS